MKKVFNIARNIFAVIGLILTIALAPNTYMESTPFTLPNTGIECSVSNSIQRFLPSDDPRAKVFLPDWTPTWDDYKRLGFDSCADLLYILEKISE